MCAFIDAAPSPFHVAQNAAVALAAAGFRSVDLANPWPGAGRWFVQRGGALIAWVDESGTGALSPSAPFTVVGAHTDSPNLRVKPQPNKTSANFMQLGVEVYGGVLLNSWLDRDLGLSGRVSIRSRAGAIEDRLVLVDRAIARLPQLAIHLDRGVNDGLKLNAQTTMSPVWGLGTSGDHEFESFLAAELSSDGPGKISAGDIVSWDIMLHDTSASAVVGNGDEFVSAPRLDNQLSCFVALQSMLHTAATASRESVAMVALFDHEEVGSVSSTGAASALLRSIIDRSVIGRGGDTDAVHRALAGSLLISSDNAHATHPNYVDRHEPEHHVHLNAGPVIKINANERYATNSSTAAEFQLACEAAGVPFQRFVNRTDLGCGSTIGPLTSAELGIATVDVGCPQLAMHSAREFSGSHDPGYLHAALNNLFSRSC